MEIFLQAFCKNSGMKKRTSNKTKLYSDIGKRIQARLDALEKSQPWLAGQLNISQSAISQMLRNPQPSKHLPKIANYLGSPYDWLAYGRGPETTPEWSRKKGGSGLESAPYTGKVYAPAETPLQDATRFVNAFADSFAPLSPAAKKTAAKMVYSVIKEYIR
jgi:transcriptional regulator with XRE-family HTH domain